MTKAKKKSDRRAIVGRIVVQSAATGRDITLRNLECGHQLLEQSGGKVHLAMFVKRCPLCHVATRATATFDPDATQKVEVPNIMRREQDPAYHDP